MQEFWKQLSPIIISTLGGLIAAVGLFVNAWLAARTEAQKQAVLGAAHEIEATSIGMDGPAKKVAAMQLAAERLPAGLRSADAKLGNLIEAVMPEVQARAEEIRASSIPPQGVGPLPTPDRSSTPTKPDRLPIKR